MRTGKGDAEVPRAMDVFESIFTELLPEGVAGFRDAAVGVEHNEVTGIELGLSYGAAQRVKEAQHPGTCTAFATELKDRLRRKRAGLQHAHLEDGIADLGLRRPDVRPHSRRSSRDRRSRA